MERDHILRSARGIGTRCSNWGFQHAEDLEDIARKFLSRLGIEDLVRPDLMTVIVKIKHTNPAFNYARVPDRDMPDAEAQWDSDNYCLRMRESVFVAMQRGEPRARMTVAHELSHFILGHQGLLNRRAVKSATEVAVTRIRYQESEARRLAPVLLAPEHQVSEQLSVDVLIDTFGLSPDAAALRKCRFRSIADSHSDASRTAFR
jgi:hypothetical protein